MNIKNLYCERNTLGVSGLFYVQGSFGTINRIAPCEITENENSCTYKQELNGVTVTAKFEQHENNVIIRKDSLKNCSDTDVTFNAFFSRFYLGGGDCEVYTQFNSWQNESNGQWQKLTTSVTAQTLGIRSCEGATPMMAVRNTANNSTTVFHIMPNAQWKITAYKKPVNQMALNIIEAGLNDTALNFTVHSGEEIFLPEIIFYNAENINDLDAYKLHRVYNKLYPRKSMPVTYNSWLYCFDKLNIENLIAQAKKAHEMGFEAFMIDAGWFGKGENWSLDVGDWYENESLDGRLKELSDLVRSLGMTFGLWFEPERAALNCKTKKERPEYYILNYLFDFSKQGAPEFMAEKIIDVINKYNIGWVKFDFNDTIPSDPENNAFYRYYEGQKRFIEIIKERFPEIYITNCASGGYRADLYQGSFTDSFWPSDNESVITEMEIIKNNIKRMPCSLIERLNVQKYCGGFPDMINGGTKGLLANCNDATWDSIVSVENSYTAAYLKSGPVGFSCDICDFPEEITAYYKDFITQFKNERDFYINADTRIIADSENFTAYQYSNADLSKITIALFINRAYAYDFRVYPVVAQNSSYQVGDKILTGEEIKSNGINFNNLKNYSCQEVTLIKR